MLNVELDKCTGCGACVQKCPKKCIGWQTGEFGFQYPILDQENCINCGLCEKVCPIGKTLIQPIQQNAYAVVHSDQRVLEDSTSGGAFGALAEYVLNLNGIIYGCSMEEGLQVKHIRVIESTGVDKLRGSKYVKSDIGTAFIETEQDLKEGKLVLFTGTPCQIVGLKNYLGKEYGNLITADIICHGVGSQAYFDKFIEFLNQRYGSVKELHFRSKEFAGWSCGGVVVAANSQQKEIRKHFYDYNNYYYYYFLRGDNYRQSCYTCPYANVQRQGDFTLGDFWGVEKLGLELKTERGCSLLLVNTEKGHHVFEKLKDIKYIEVSIDQAKKQNKQLNEPSKESTIRNVLIKEFDNLTGEQINKEFRRRNKKARIKGQIKALIPYKVRLVLRKMVKR